MTILTGLLAGARDRDRVLAALGALIGIALTAWFCARLPTSGLPMIVAPLGASAVLLFAVPTSPLAQPWPVFGGNVIAACVGVAVAQAIGVSAVSAGAAVGGAILVMSLCRCLHPPGGAAALTAVVGGPGIAALGYAFPLTIVAANSAVLIVTAWLFHRATRRSYPHRPAATVMMSAGVGLHRADIEAALAELDESFDITVEDLAVLLTRAEGHAARRR